MRCPVRPVLSGPVLLAVATSCTSIRKGPSSLSTPPATAKIAVDPFCRRSIRGISELNRQAYFGLCDHGGTNFDQRCKSKERYDWLIKENGITFGRALGVVNGLDRWYKAIREDPARPGFADTAYLEEKLAPYRKDPGDEFRHDLGGRLNAAAHGNHKRFPSSWGRTCPTDPSHFTPLLFPGLLGTTLIIEEH